MENIPVKQLIKTALGTAPIMGLMLITPVFLLTTGVHNFNFFMLWAAVTAAISFAWVVHIVFLCLVRHQWIITWIRVAVIGAIMYGLSFMVFIFIVPQLKIDQFIVEIIRLTNILAVNAIIYILIDLTLTKENKNKYALENSNLKLVNLEAEYKLLKDQINPHFLFNALSTAKALIRKQPQLAEEYIIRLSEFLRSSLNNNKKTVSLKEELDLCSEFVSLNQIRFGNALQYENTIKIDLEIYSVPYFSVLSLIENCIKHNVFTIETPLHISVSTNNDYLEVRNNKQVKFVIKDSSKTGLNNLNNRYKLLHAEGIVINETDNQFSVQIALLKK